jgi:hypothetical protein
VKDESREGGAKTPSGKFFEQRNHIKLLQIDALSLFENEIKRYVFSARECEE